MEVEEMFVFNLYQILIIYLLYFENVNILFIIQIFWKYNILKLKFLISVQMYMYFDVQLIQCIQGLYCDKVYNCNVK